MSGNCLDTRLDRGGGRRIVARESHASRRLIGARTLPVQRLLSLRDRLLSSTAFQSWALRNPFVRPMARRRAAALFDLCAGFVYSQILFACVRLQLFPRLENGPQAVAALAAGCGLTKSSLMTLLQ